jgi:hypothetical protein
MHGMKIEPVYKPLPDMPTASRIFTPWGPRKRSHSDRMQIKLGQQQNMEQASALFAIRYNPDTSGATEEIVINGNLVHIPLSAAKALRVVFDNTEIMSGLAAGWAPWFWMDCICINAADQTEVEKQRKLEPWIYAISKWTLDCTGPLAQIKLGSNAYTAAVVNYGDTGDVLGSAIAAGEALDNLDRLRGHIPGRVIWQESR